MTCDLASLLGVLYGLYLLVQSKPLLKPFTHLVVPRHIGHAAEFAGQLVLDAVDSVVVDVDGADEHVVRDVV